MNKNVIMGIDTSNYTTSVALMYSDGELIANLKLPLAVKNGERGLRQSDAVFSHIKNFPLIMREVKVLISGKKLSAIGVSKQPRNIEGSYMPCFLSGVSVAESIAAAMDIPIYTFSHQCGHIMAAVYSSGAYGLLEKEFAALHVSGGTTELLKVKYSGSAFLSEIVGGSSDLNAGQVIDRIGVSLGLHFPAGRFLEALALENDIKITKKRPKISEFKVSFSGLENLAENLYRKTGNKPHVAAFVFDYIGEAISLLCETYTQNHGATDFLFAGGVMSNSIIRASLEKKFNSYFAAPEFSADNAVGIAELARRAYLMENE